MLFLEFSVVTRRKSFRGWRSILFLNAIARCCCPAAAARKALYAHNIDVDLGLDLVAPGTKPSGAPSFVVKQYNILAGYLGKNTEPWFLTRAGLSQARREQILDSFYAKDANTGQYINNFHLNRFGADSNGEPFLNSSQAAAVIETDAAFFKWDVRKEKLIHEFLVEDPDILVLEELDHFHDFFEEELARRGYSGVWAKRPRSSSEDGCGIFWRQSRFSLRGSENYSLQDTPELTHAVPDGFVNSRAQARFLTSMNVEKREDRIVLLAALVDKLADNRNILVVSTHLQRNPEDLDKDYTRLVELQEIGYFLKNFSKKYNLQIKDDVVVERGRPARFTPAQDAVVLAGDFNSVRRKTHSYTNVADVVRMLSRGQMCNAFPSDVAGDDDCTSATEARRMWIDYLFYSGSALELLEVFKDPCPAAAIPDEEHPSDHMPIAMKLAWRPHENISLDMKRGDQHERPTLLNGFRRKFCHITAARAQVKKFNRREL